MLQKSNRYITSYNISLFLLAASAVVLLLIGLGASPIYILDEARNAQAAREMMERQNWIVPTFNGELRSQKPPLHYYFMSAGYWLFGVNSIGARFFSGVMGLLTIYTTWFFVSRFMNRRAALLAAVALLSSTHFLFEFRLAVPDPYLIFFVTAGIFFFYAFIKEDKLRWLIASAVFAGLATLAKGPIALALPGLALCLWMIFQGKRNLLFSWKMLLFLAVVAIVALPWYVAVHQATNGEFTKEFFIRHNVDRFGEPMEGHGGIFLLIPLFVLIGYLPFSIFSGEIIRTRRILKKHDLVSLSVWVILVFIIFFSLCQTKLPNYPMPCYPFIAVLLGYWIDSILSLNIHLKRYPFIILLVLNCLLPVAAWIALRIEPATAPLQWWALILLVLPVTSCICWLIFRQKDLRKALPVLVAGYTAFNILMLVFAYPAVYNENPVRKTLALLRGEQQVYAYKIYNPAYNFYLPLPIKVLQKKEDLQVLFSLHPDAKVISRANELEDLGNMPIHLLASERDLFETPTTVIFSSR